MKRCQWLSFKIHWLLTVRLTWKWYSYYCFYMNSLISNEFPKGLFSFRYVVFHCQSSVMWVLSLFLTDWNFEQTCFGLKSWSLIDYLAFSQQSMKHLLFLELLQLFFEASLLVKKKKTGKLRSACTNLNKPTVEILVAALLVSSHVTDRFILISFESSESKNSQTWEEKAKY